MMSFILADLLLNIFYNLKQSFSKNDYYEEYNPPETYPEIVVKRSGPGKIKLTILYVPNYAITAYAGPPYCNNNFWKFMVNGYDISKRGIYQ